MSYLATSAKCKEDTELKRLLGTDWDFVKSVTYMSEYKEDIELKRLVGMCWPFLEFVSNVSKYKEDIELKRLAFLGVYQSLSECKEDTKKFSSLFQINMLQVSVYFFDKFIFTYMSNVDRYLCTFSFLIYTTLPNRIKMLSNAVQWVRSL